MKRIFTLIIVLGLFFGWLFSAPPAWACSPVPAQAWFVPYFEVQSDDVSLEIQSLGWGQPNAYTLRLRNLSAGVIYLIGSNQIEFPEPLDVLEYVPPPGFEVYLSVAQVEVEVLDETMFSISFGLQDKNVYAETRPEFIEPPTQQRGFLWVVVDGKEVPAPLTLTYSINPNFFETDHTVCSDYYFIQSLLVALFYGFPLAAITLVILLVRQKRKVRKS